MRGIRFVVGRLRYSTERAVHVIVFDSREFSERDARAWLLDNGFKARVLERDGRWWRSRQRERAEFDQKSFRTVETGRREVVTMASNPKRKRRAGKKRRARRRRKVSASSRPLRRRRTGLRVNARRRVRRRRRNPKTVRTDVRTVKVMRTNARKRRRRARRSRHYTVAFTPATARQFASIARLSKMRRREMRRAMRRHPSGGVYVALPTWHGTAAQAKRLASRAWLLLVYSAGRRRASLTSSAPPRVVAVP